MWGHDMQLPERHERVSFRKWLCFFMTGLGLTAALLFAVGWLLVRAVSAEEAPREPAFDQMLSWQPDRGAGVVIAYEIDGDTVYFAHPVQESGMATDCAPVYQAGNILYLLTIDGIPYRYSVSVEPSMWRVDGKDWEGVVQKTFEVGR